MTSKNSSAQKENVANDAGSSEKVKGKMLMRMMAKSVMEKTRASNVQKPAPLQRRHTTGGRDESNYSLVDSKVTGNREQESFIRSYSLPSTPEKRQTQNGGDRASSKPRQPRSSKHSTSKTQSSRRAVKPPAAHEDDESVAGCNADWILGQDWIMGIMTALEEFSLFPDAEKEDDSEFPNTALGYRVASSGSLQFRKVGR